MMNVSDDLREYAEEKIGNAMKVINMDPMEAEVVLHVERNRAISNHCCCEVTIRAKGNVIRVEEYEQDMYAAVDVGDFFKIAVFCLAYHDCSLCP